MSTYRVQEFDQLLKGEKLKLYVGVMQADDLLERYNIPSIDPENDQGYQRPVWPSRVNSIASYIIVKGGLLPTAILVNVRGQYKLHDGMLDIPDGRCLFVVDGQHRIKGMERARERRHPLPYSIPVVFSLGLTTDQEMRLFVVVNNEARSVPADVTIDLLRRQVTSDINAGENVSEAQQRKAVAADVAHRLAREPGIWQHKIQMSDELKQWVPGNYKKPIRFATMARTLEPFLRGDWASGRVVSRDVAAITKVVKAYWQALATLMPETVTDVEHYALLGPTGAYVFNTLLRDIARRADRAGGDWTPQFMAGQLKASMHWVESPTWHRATGDQLTRMKGAAPAKMILEQIAPLFADTPGLD